MIDDDAIEPVRPDGLGTLSPALESLADIVELDRDLLAMAAEGAPRAAPSSSVRDVEQWLRGLDPAEHVAPLSRVAGGDGSVSAELMRPFRQHALQTETLLRRARDSSSTSPSLFA